MLHSLEIANWVTEKDVLLQELADLAIVVQRSMLAFLCPIFNSPDSGPCALFFFMSLRHDNAIANHANVPGLALLHCFLLQCKAG